MKFKGIINPDKYSQLSYIEKYKLIIENEVYSPIKDNTFESEDFFIIENVSDSNELITFAKKINFDNCKYELNHALIEELENSLQTQILNTFETWNDRKKTLKIQYEYLPELELKIIIDQNKIEYSKILNEKIVIELENQDHNEVNSHIPIIKKYALRDYFFIFEYLIGIKNECRSCHSHYMTYLKCKTNIEIIDELLPNNNNTALKISLPKKIALLHDLGLLKTDEFRKYTSADQHKLIAFLLGLSFERNDIASVRRNLAVLADFSNESTTKYTSYKHVGKIIKEILK